MNLLITGAWGSASEYIGKIEKLGHKVSFLQYEKDALPCAYDWVEGVICNGFFLSHPIEKFVHLKYIQLTSAGFDRVPLEYVKDHGIQIHNARGVYSVPMAEFAVAGVLQLYKQMRFFADNQKQHIWKKNRSLLELCGKTVCIVGCGSVGNECAKRFQAFGCRVTGVDLFPGNVSNCDRMYGMDRLDQVLPETDVLILTLPLTEETRHMMAGEQFRLLKDGAVLVNIARGALVDGDALIDALGRRLGGAVLDVFEEEPLDTESPLWDMEHVIVTPHNSFVGENNRERLSEVLLNNLSAYIERD